MLRIRKIVVLGSSAWSSACVVYTLIKILNRIWLRIRIHKTASNRRIYQVEIMDQPVDVTEIDVGYEDDISVQLKNLKVQNWINSCSHVIILLNLKMILDL